MGSVGLVVLLEHPDFPYDSRLVILGSSSGTDGFTSACSDHLVELRATFSIGSPATGFPHVRISNGRSSLNSFA